MVDQKKSRYWTPTRTYELELKIGKQDYTNDLYKVSIISSIEVPYQSIILELFLDPNDIILEKIYGQTSIKLICRLLGFEPNIELERIEFDLMVVTTGFSIPQEEVINNDARIAGYKDRKAFTLTTVPGNAYKTMNTIVNGAYQGITLSAVIQLLIENNIKGVTINYDTSGRNYNVIDQILVPPTTLYKAIKFLNKTFGLFNGAYTVYCDYKNNIFIKNITSKMKTSQAFTIWHLASNTDNRKIVEDNNSTSFYTYEDVVTSYAGNSVFAALSPVNRFIVKPNDRLSATIPIDLEEFAGDYGLISKTKKIYFNSKAIDPSVRISYFKDHTGYNLSSSFINANMSKTLSELATMTLNVYKNIYLEPLMKVGDAVQLNSKVTNVREFTGKYILKASEIMFSRVKDWENQARLYLIRTNRTD
jgi:hypothetical protein